MQLSTTEYAVLGLLGFGERSGYDLARLAARSIDYMWAPSRSQIYKVLPRLVEAGYARSRQVEQQSRPDKALYRLTPPGRRALRDWIERVDEPGDGEPTYQLKVFFGWAAPAPASLAQLDAYRRWLEQRLRELEDIERTLPADEPVHSRLALRLGIERSRVALAWTETARRELA